jgi:hypothetical protein
MDRFLIDECLSADLVATAKARGYDADYVPHIGKALPSNKMSGLAPTQTANFRTPSRPCRHARTFEFTFTRPERGTG